MAKHDYLALRDNLAPALRMHGTRRRIDRTLYWAIAIAASLLLLILLAAAFIVCCDGYNPSVS